MLGCVERVEVDGQASDPKLESYLAIKHLIDETVRQRDAQKQFTAAQEQQLEHLQVELAEAAHAIVVDRSIGDEILRAKATVVLEYTEERPDSDLAESASRALAIATLTRLARGRPRI